MLSFIDDDDPLAPWTTVERQDLMREYYPKLVEAYEESIKKPPKEKKPKATRKKNPTGKVKSRKKQIQNVNDNDLDGLNKTFSNMSINTYNKSLNKSVVSVKVNKLKRKLRSTHDKAKTQKTIDSFLPKRRKSNKLLMRCLRNSLRNISMKKLETEDQIDVNYENKENIVGTNEIKHNLSTFDWSCDNYNDSDLSNILDNIVSSAPVTKTAVINNKVVKLVFANHASTPAPKRKSGFRKSVLSEIQKNSSTPKNSPIRNKSFNISSTENLPSKINTSYFFEKLTDECDAFEMSIENKNEDYCNMTVNYSIEYL